LKKQLGIIGFGSFGQFISKYLIDHFDVIAYDEIDKSIEAKKVGIQLQPLETVAKSDILILCVPVQYLDKLLLNIKEFVKDGALVMDVSSVKVKPIALMKKTLPEHVEIIGTHPLFGPQSGKNGIEDLKCVICHDNTPRSSKVMHFLEDILNLEVLDRSAITHDKQMAYVQALTHFVGRAINQMDIPEVEQTTKAYESLINVKKKLGKDSFELFKTIEEENPYAKAVREHFLEELNKLNSILD